MPESLKHKASYAFFAFVLTMDLDPFFVLL